MKKAIGLIIAFILYGLICLALQYTLFTLFYSLLIKFIIMGAVAGVMLFLWRKLTNK